MCSVHRIVSAVSATPQLHYCQERDPAPLCRAPGGPQVWSRWEWKISPQPEFDPRPIQPVASCYTNYAIPVHNVVSFLENCRVKAIIFL